MAIVANAQVDRRTVLVEVQPNRVNPKRIHLGAMATSGLAAAVGHWVALELDLDRAAEVAIAMLRDVLDADAGAVLRALELTPVRDTLGARLRELAS
jgi:hypothetical protein